MGIKYIYGTLLVVIGLLIRAQPSSFNKDSAYWRKQVLRAEEFLDENPDTTVVICERTLHAVNLGKGIGESLDRNTRQLAALALINLGRAYEGYGDIPKAMPYYEQALKIYDAINDIKGHALAINNMAQVYESTGDVDNAFRYYRQCLLLLRSVKDRQGESDALNNMAHVYENKDMFDSAMYYFNASRNIRESIGDTIGIAMSLNNLGTLYFMMGKYEEAERHFEASVPLRRAVDDKSGMAASLTNLAYVYIRSGKTNEAIQVANEALKLSYELHQPGKVRSAAKILYGIHKKAGHFKEALANYDLYILMLDSINKESNKKASMRSQLKYEYGKKAAADSVRAAEEKRVVQAQLKQEQTQRYALYGGLGLVAVFAVFMVNRFRATNAQKKIIEKQKKLVEEQKHQVEEKQKEILDSIYYARRIQRALITSEHYINRKLKSMLR